MKRLAAAKSRLAGVLSCKARVALVLAMAEDVLAALRDCSQLDGIVVVTDDPVLARVAEAHGCPVEPEHAAGGLNAALEAVAERLDLDGDRSMLVVPADVPCIRTADVQAILEAHAGGITLCIAEADQGTNAMLCSPPGAVPLLFGRESGLRHLESARRRGIAANRVSLPRLRDIDRPTDLEWLASVGRHTRSGQVLLDLWRTARCGGTMESARVA